MTIGEWKKEHPKPPEIREGLYPHPIPPERVKAFKKLLKQRLGKGCMTKLCRMARVGRTHFTNVLAGDRDGKFTWPRVDDFLSQEERHVLRGTLSELEQNGEQEQGSENGG